LPEIMKKMVNFRIFAGRGASILAGPRNVWTAPAQLDPLMRPGRILAECAASHRQPRVGDVPNEKNLSDPNSAMNKEDAVLDRKIRATTD
jgi:hypothetical protein